MKAFTRIVRNEKGVSLTEAILAVAMLTIVVVSLSLSLSHSSKNAMFSDQRRIAGNLASTYLAELKSQPYAFVNLTDAGAFSGDATCDCTTVNYSTLPSTSTAVSGSTYQIASCINYVSRSGSSWVSQCPSATDTGYKNFVVTVSWTHQAKNHLVKQSSSMTRF